jgi:hypothetical protein
MMRIVHRGSRHAHRAVDALVEHYVSWREECERVRLAYERWNRAERTDARLAYAGYLAALDREELAAKIYANQIGCVSLVCSRETAPAGT